MGSVERTELLFLEALKAAHFPLKKMSEYEIASWIVARLNFITSETLELEGNAFAHDTDEFGYQFRLSDQSDTKLAHGAVMFHADRIYFAALDIKTENFQSIFIDLLTDAPNDLSKCEIVVQDPETKRKRRYGWDGYSLLNR